MLLPERIRRLFDVLFWYHGYSSGLQMLAKSHKQFKRRKTKARNKMSQYLSDIYIPVNKETPRLTAMHTEILTSLE